MSEALAGLEQLARDRTTKDGLAAARRVAEADAAGRAAHSALQEAARTELTRALDVWFDNIFSDWTVRDRIAQASDRVQQLVTAGS